MAGRSLTPPSGSYAEYVVSLSSAFTDLKPLAELMMGGDFNPRRVDKRWTSSEKVDVVAVDIFPNSPYFKFYNIGDLQSLKDFCSSEIGPDVKLRLFLIEDMTAVVVETLGSAFALPPLLFNCHMKHSGNVLRGSVGEPFPTFEQPLSRFRDPEFFSFPFQRYFENREHFGKSAPRQRYTMYRDHHVEGFVLEERTSGIICSHQSSGCRIGVFLFDGSIDFVTGKRLTIPFRINFREHPKFRALEATLPMPMTPLYTMRDVLLSAFSSQYASTLLTDESTILWTILQVTVSEWLIIIDIAEQLISTEMRCSLDINKHDLTHRLKEEVSVKESVQLLKESSQIIKAKKGWKLPQTNSQGSSQIREDLETDIEDLTKRFEAVSSWTGHRLQMFAALVGIEESQRAITQSKKIGVLTGLATFYIPLSFVTSFFGMNLSPVVGSEFLSIWVFFIVAVPLTAISLYVVLKWDLVYGVWSYFMRKMPSDYSSKRRRRWKSFVTKGEFPKDLPSSR